MEQQFEEWCEKFILHNLVYVLTGYERDIAKAAFEAGYNQRSSEVAEDLRLFRGLMSNIRIDPDE